MAVSHIRLPPPESLMTAARQSCRVAARRVSFWSAARTVNEDLILGRLDRHGELVCHSTEVPLEPRYTTAQEVACYLADVLALFRGPRGLVLVGIEVKDRGAPVGSRMAARYLAAYRRSCQYFYLAANAFTPRVFAMRDVGLFHLDRREVVKGAGALSPEPALWRSAVSRLAEACRVEVGVPRDPLQTTLGDED